MYICLGLLGAINAFALWACLKVASDCDDIDGM